VTSEQRRRNRITGIILLIFAVMIFIWTFMQGGEFIVGFSSN
jgi:hypothetical protein